MTHQTTVSDYIARSLWDLGIEHVFTLPSASIDPLLKRLCAGKPKPIVVTHELAAGFMADGYARAKGVPGVALAGSGIASLYLLPAISNARIEGIPVLALTGDIPSHLSGDFPFQNTGYAGTRDAAIYREATGQSVKLAAKTISEKWQIVIERLLQGQSAHVAIPFDVQKERAEIRKLSPRCETNEVAIEHVEVLHEMAQRLIAARRPLIVFGPRVAQLKGKNALQRLLSLSHARFVTSIGAIGHLNHETPRYLGSYGYCGTPDANHAIADPDCDFILLVGGRPGQRDGMRWKDKLRQAPQLLARIDTPGSGMLDVPTFADLTPEIFSEAVAILADFISKISTRGQVGKHDDSHRKPQRPENLVESCIAQAQAHFGTELVAFVDSGLHRCAAIRAWKSNGHGDFHMSAEQAPMGWAIAASIGASIARSDITTFCITGDGCMRLLGQELATAARYETRSIFFVVNNGGLGSIIARAESDAEVEALGQQQRVDWVSFAQTLGVDGTTASDMRSFQKALDRVSATKGPFVIDLQVPLQHRQGSSDSDTRFIGAPYAD